jgi:transcriptional regulator with GAF, ATPase, and Fis domain
MSFTDPSHREPPSDDRSRSERVDRALDQLGSISLQQYSMETLLQTVTELATSVMPGDPEASITVRTGHRPFTVVSSGQLATDLDEVQYAEQGGPCLHAAATLELTEIPDTRVETRWPDYARRAVERGNLSSLSVPLDMGADISGALNIYARVVDAFDDDARAAAARLGPYAAAAVGNVYAYESAQDTAHNLQVALESRAVIDQAKGILMERYRMTADQAFQLLAGVSTRSNTKLREIAERLVLTGDLPEPLDR